MRTFAMRAEDVMPVLKALRSNGIEVVAAAIRAAVDQTGHAASARR